MGSINCWDTNVNRVDDTNEDVNGDGLWDVNDCAPIASAGISQNPSVDLNYQYICEALANLGQYPQGCPSASHTTPNAGTFQQIQVMLNDGTGKGVSCGLSNNGLLTLEKNQFDQLYYWKLEGGFIASSRVIALADELGGDFGNNPGNSCLDICMSDSECIASLAESREVSVGSSTSTIYDCALFHHSDTIPPYERVCDDVFANCAATGGALLVGQRWGIRCP